MKNERYMNNIIINIQNCRLVILESEYMFSNGHNL